MAARLNFHVVFFNFFSVTKTTVKTQVGEMMQQKVDAVKRIMDLAGGL